MLRFLFWLLLTTLAPAGTLLAQGAVGDLQALLKGAQTVGDDELLPPEQAFAVRAVADAPDLVAIEYQVADGYYLYRNKFRFESTTAGVELGTAWVPAGELKHDEFFGEVETHRGLVSIGLPLLERPSDLQDLTLVLTSQGCADVGVCYPPFTQNVELSMPAVDDDPAALDAVKELGDALGAADGEPELLDPDEAFAIRIDDAQSGQLQVMWDIADGYYMYLERMAFKIDEVDELALGEPRYSESKIKEDEFFGRMAVFYHQATATLPVSGPATTARTKLYVRYQGCADVGVCYPPVAKTFDVNLSGGASTSVVNAPPADSGSPAAMSEQDRIAASLGSNSLWLTILSFLGLGLLLTFTPCVFPMIPILSSIIAGQGTSVTTSKAFSLSLVYVLAMAMTYTVAGVLVGLSGENVQAMFQDPWIIGVFAGIFVLLSLSMFGFYELQMPGVVQSKLTALSNSQQGGTYTGVAIMGLLSALIVGPCVTAPLVGALIYIAQTGDAVLGGVALFALSMGMGVPLLIIGTSAGKILPKAGPWMDATKAVFGVLLLGLAIWLLERILPVAITMSLWAVLLLISAIYLGALEPIREGASGWFRLWKGVGLVSLIAGVLLLIGAAAGSNSMLQPLKGVFSVASAPGQPAAATSHASFVQVKGLAELEQAIASANAKRQTVMLDFYADWCISCKEMEAFTFTDPQVQAALSQTVWLQTDVTRNDDLDKALLKHFGLFGPPAILFFDHSGQERRNQRVVGFMEPQRFLRQVELAFTTTPVATAQRTGY